jgi:outer membrane lipoprotein-sorting protein
MVPIRSRLAQGVKILLLFVLVYSAAAADTNAVLESWLAAQSQLKTWTADFTQTRTLKTFREPLLSTGHLTFKAPNNFRWELLSPQQTLAIRNSNEMVVIYPKLKRAEKYPLTGAGNEPWRDALALMDAGFPASRAELESRFKLTSISFTGELAQIIMEPRSAMARRFMNEVQLILRMNDFSMAANQLRFADGSTMRNDFTKAVKNPTIQSNAFSAELPADYKVIEPMKK